MCYYVGADTILANLLSVQENETATPAEISDYCKQVYIELRSKDKNSYAYFDITSDAINNMVATYSDFFEIFYNKIYLKREINVESFNKNISFSLKRALKQAAKDQALKQAAKTVAAV